MIRGNERRIGNGELDGKKEAEKKSLPMSGSVQVEMGGAGHNLGS